MFCEVLGNIWTFPGYGYPLGIFNPSPGVRCHCDPVTSFFFNEHNNKDWHSPFSRKTFLSLHPAKCLQAWEESSGKGEMSPTNYRFPWAVHCTVVPPADTNLEASEHPWGDIKWLESFQRRYIQAWYLSAFLSRDFRFLRPGDYDARTRLL